MRIGTLVYDLNTTDRVHHRAQILQLSKPKFPLLLLKQKYFKFGAAINACISLLGATKLSKFGPNYSKFAIPNGRGIHPGSVRYHGISKQYGRLYRNEEVIESFNSEKWLIEDFCDFLQRLEIRKY